MSDPNAQEQKPKKLFSQRGTSFLSLSGASSNQSQPAPAAEEPPPEAAYENEAIQEAVQHPFPTTQLPPMEQVQQHTTGYISEAVGASPTGPIQEPQQPQPQPKPRTGVIGSQIHYPPKKETEEYPPETPSATPTGTLKQKNKSNSTRVSRKITAEEKEAKLDSAAEKITAILGKFIQLKVDLFDNNKRWSEKIGSLVEKNPAFFRQLRKVMGLLATPFRPVLQLMSRVNQKLVERNLIRSKRPKYTPNSDNGPEIPPENAAPPEKISFLELAEKNIVFCDNRKRPLYSIEQLRGKHGYTASEEVIAPMIYANILTAFQEVAPKAKAIPTPQSGVYAGTPMDQVMENITEMEIMIFLNYVKRFPRGYVGKNFRITESFAGWVVSGTPDD